MYKEVLKRTAALFLCACMIGTSIDVSGFTVYAAEEQETVTKTQGKAAVSAQSEAAPTDWSANPEKVVITYDTNNVYDGTQKTPIVSAVTYDGVRVDSSEYMISYGTNINAGTNAGAITLIGNGIKYTGIVTKTFDITPLDIKNVTLNSAAASSETYTGSPVEKKKSSIVLTLGNKTLSENEYDIKCTDKGSSDLTKAIGMKTLTITGKNNCTGTKTVDYEVKQKSFNDNTGFQIDEIPNQAYNDGNAVILDDIFITYNGEPLTKGIDYTLSHSNNTTITNQAKLIITGKGNFTGSTVKNFSIVGKDIASCTVSLSASDFTYNGKKQVPQTITVTDPATGSAVSSTNYEVSYSDPVNAGTCIVTVTGKGNYAGTATASYEIKRYDFSTASTSEVIIGGITKAVYNGGAQVKPTPTVRVNGIGYLEENVDFVYDYQNNEKASDDAEVIIVGDIKGGNSNFTGSITKKFTIEPRDLSGSEVTVEVEDWTRPGTQVSPAVVVKYNDEVLQRNQDYKVTFKDVSEKNELDASAEEIDAVAIIEPADSTKNYTGSKRKTFYVYGNMEHATATCTKAYTYTGKTIVPSGSDLLVTSKMNQTLREGESYTIQTGSNVLVGTNYQATLLGTGKFSYSKTITYDIVKKPLTDADITWSIEDPVYTGEKVKPTVTATLPSGVTLVEGTDFILEELSGQSSNYYVDAKDGVKINVAAKTSGGSDSHNFSGSKTITFNIKPRAVGDASYHPAGDITVEGVKENYAYTGANINPTEDPGFVIKRNGVALTKDVDYKIQSVTDNLRAGTATITVTGKGNYNGAFKITFQIKYSVAETYATWKIGKMVDSEFVETKEFEYDLGKSIKPVLQGAVNDFLPDGTTINETLQLGKDYTVSFNNNTEVSPSKTQLAKVTINGIGNYMGSKVLEFEIVPKYITEGAANIVENSIVEGFMVYDGLPHKWESKILSHYTTELVYNTDYQIIKCVNSGDDDPTASPSTCINAGKIELTLKGINNYQGERTVSYVVDKMDFSNKERIQMTQPVDIPYDGKPHKLEAKDITGTYTPSTSGAVPLAVTEKDYDVVSWVDEGDNDPSNTDSECINAGKVTITLKAKEKNYTGTRTIEYNIVPRSLQESDIQYSASMTSTVYNREVQNPTVEVSSTSSEIGALELDKDYTVSYEKKVQDEYGVATYQQVTECKDAGEYRIVVAGKNNFKDTIKIPYTINQRDLNESAKDYRFAIAEIVDQTYTGEAIIPEDLEVFEYTYDSLDPSGTNAAERKKEGMSPVRDIDYTVACSDNVNATRNNGNTKAYLTITGTGNYKGALAAQFTILPKDINDNVDGQYDVELSEILKEEYNGSAITPTLPLEYNGRQLTEGASRDYTVSYEVEEEDEEGNTNTVVTNVNVGPVYGTITGYGNYTGTRKFTKESPIFEIVPRSLANNYKEDNTGEIKVTVAEENGGKVIYDGLEHKPVVTLRDTLMGEEPLVFDKDYTVEYSNAVDAGQHTITITGKGNYSDEIEITYIIHPKCLLDEHLNLKDEECIENILDLTYTGSELTQQPKITDKEITVEEEPYVLEEGKDYTLSYENNLNASTQSSKAVVTISFCGNYTGYYQAASSNLEDDYKNNTYKVEFNVLPRDIEDDGIQLEEIAAEEYNKAEHEPDVVMTYGKTEENAGYTLIKDVDYKLTYNENQNQENGNHTAVGTVTVTIRGIGNFVGMRTTSFEILPKSLDADISPDITVEAIPQQEYCGKNIVPDVTVMYGGVQLVKGVDYETVAGTNTVMPGMATVVIKGMGDYRGQRIAEFKIVGNLGTDGTIETIPVQAYTGSQVAPTPKVSFKGTELTEGVDYDVIYDNNTEVGTATFTIVGKDGYYTGTKSVGYKIAYDISMDTLERESAQVSQIATEYTYTAGIIKPIPKVSYAGTELKEGTDYTISYKNNIDAGTAEVTITGQNRYMGSVTRTFKIVKKSLSNCTISAISDEVYDGKAKTPAVVVKNGTTTLVRGVDYTVSYETNKEAGVGKMILKGQKNYSGTVIRYFNIKVAAPKSLKISSNSATSIKLSWSAGGKATGYEVYRLESNGKYKRIATTSKTTYTNTKLKNSKSYKYKVRAYYKSSTGKVYSSFTSVLTTNTTPETPKIALYSKKSKQIQIKWSKLNLGTGYEVYQSTSKNGKYTKIKTVTSYKTTSYTKKSLKSKKTYYYKVRAYKTINGKKVYGKYSSIKSKKVK